jgi:hypothetical protein
MEEIDNKLQELQNSKNYSYQDNDVDKVLWTFWLEIRMLSMKILIRN